MAESFAERVEDVSVAWFLGSGHWSDKGFTYLRVWRGLLNPDDDGFSIRKQEWGIDEDGRFGTGYERCD